MAVGAVLGAGTNLAGQLVRGGPIDWGEVSVSAATGAILGIPVVGVSVAIISAVVGLHLFLKHPSAETGLFVIINTLSAYCGLRGLAGAGGGGPGLASALAGGGTSTMAQSVSRAVIADTLISSGVSGFNAGLVYNATDGDDGDNTPTPIARPGYKGPPEGFERRAQYSNEPMPDISFTYIEDRIAKGPPYPAEGFIYVVDRNGKVRLGRLSQRHSFLTKGDNVFGAGMMDIDNNNITYIDDISGYYHTDIPFGDQFFNYLKYILEDQGFSIPNNVFMRR